MTPSRRIARVQRWLSSAKSGLPNGLSIHYNARNSLSYFRTIRERHHRRKLRAFSLFAAELAWLAEYAKGLRELVDNAAAFANNFGIEVQSFDYRAQGDLRQTFTCPACRRSVPWSEGAADAHPDLCDRCATEEQP